jgi:hypothetical protein
LHYLLRQIKNDYGNAYICQFDTHPTGGSHKAREGSNAAAAASGNETTNAMEVPIKSKRNIYRTPIGLRRVFGKYMGLSERKCYENE